MSRCPWVPPSIKLLRDSKLCNLMLHLLQAPVCIDSVSIAHTTNQQTASSLYNPPATSPMDKLKGKLKASGKKDTKGKGKENLN